MTDTERLLWSKIRRKQLGGAQFYRQKPLGNYIVDFYCSAAKLVVEVDGGQHYTDQRIESDESRHAYLDQLGLQVLRFSDLDVLKNLEGVVCKIREFMEGESP